MRSYALSGQEMFRYQVRAVVFPGQVEARIRNPKSGVLIVWIPCEVFVQLCGCKDPKPQTQNPKP